MNRKTKTGRTSPLPCLLHIGHVDEPTTSNTVSARSSQRTLSCQLRVTSSGDESLRDPRQSPIRFLNATVPFRVLWTGSTDHVGNVGVTITGGSAPSSPRV